MADAGVWHLLAAAATPASPLQGAGSALQGAVDAAGAAGSVLSGALTIITQVLRFFTDTGHFVQDAVNWMTASLFPPELQTWFLGTIGAPGQQWDSTQIYQDIYRSVQAPALALTAVASTSRLLRGTVDHRLSSAHALLDVLPRFLLALLVIGVPGTSVSLGYIVIVYGINASMVVATALFSLVLRASLLKGVAPGQGWFTHMFNVVANAGHSAVAVVVAGIPLLILILYVVFLMVVRTVMIGFCVVTAPLCFATAAFDVRNRFLQWWADLFIGVLMTPIVLGVCIAVSVSLASSIVSAYVVGPILAFVVMCGGLWFAGKMVHHLTWRHFSHGSAMAGFAAGVSAMLAPAHRLANAGFLAEAFGANRGGDNSAVNFMKRVGLASQGFNPGAGLSPAMAAGAPGSADQSEISPSHGTPDVAAALSGAGRTAVSGAEHVFSRQAFNAFTHGNARLIGASTRDVPVGSVPFADRARLAWERSSPRSKTTFADDYLAVWLGSSTSHSTVAADRTPSLVPGG